MVFEEILINQFLQSFSTPTLNLFFKLITYFGHPIVWMLLAAWYFWVGKEKKSFMVASTILFVGFIAGGLKELIARPRPEGLLPISTDEGFSFPSGHATLTSAFFGFYEKKLKRKIKWIMFALVILTAISRIYLGVHYLTDVLAGLVLGYIIGKAMLILEKRVEKARFHISAMKEEGLIVLLFIAIIAGLYFLPEYLYMVQALLGYYLGFAIFAHTKIKLKPKHPKIALSFGTVIFGGIGGAAYITHDALAMLLFFIGGLFISIIWPLIIHKAKI